MSKVKWAKTLKALNKCLAHSKPTLLSLYHVGTAFPFARPSLKTAVRKRKWMCSCWWGWKMRRRKQGVKGRRAKSPWFTPMVLFWFHSPGEAIFLSRQKEWKLNCDLESDPFWPLVKHQEPVRPNCLWNSEDQTLFWKSGCMAEKETEVPVMKIKA